MSALDLVRPDLLALRGYSSARLEAPPARVALDANESPLAPPGSDATLALNRYPEPQPPRLRAQLAALYGVPEASVLVGRGSDEAIDLLTRALCRAGRDAVLVSPPTFGFYAVAAEVQGARVVRVPLSRDDFAWRPDAVLAAADRDVRLVYVCTPNNPTGGRVAREAILALAAELEGRALVVVDEAYVEYAASPSLAPEAAQGRLAVLRTLSKAHALAGARVGALVAEPALVAVLRRIMAPYPLPTPSVRAAEAALEPATLAETRRRIAAVVAERERVAEALRCCDAVAEVLPSHANFLAVRFRDARATWRGLAARGVLVRDVSMQHGLDGCLRVAIGSRDDNDALLDALVSLEAAA